MVGCDREHKIDFPPAAAGHVSVKGKDGAWQEVALTKEQLLQLSSWVNGRRDGWRELVVTPPLPTFSIGLEASDGRKYTIQVFVRATGGGTAYAYGAAPELPLSHGMSDEDIVELRARVGVVAP